MLLPTADKAKMTALLLTKGVRAPEDAVFEELPRCRAYKLRWRGKAGECTASLFTSSGQPTLTFVGRSIPVSLGDLYALDMVEEREEPT